MQLSKCREYSLPLITGVILALFLSNIAPEFYTLLVFETIPGTSKINMNFLVNNIFMVFFFGLAGIEITKNLSKGGVLNPAGKAATPLMATAGGVLCPILVFNILNNLIGSSEFSNGWGIPTATDVALSYLVARAIFGKSHPAVGFLLLLAVADDGIGMFIITVFYSDSQMQTEPLSLIAVAFAVITAYVMKKRKVQNIWLYILLPGHIAWLGLYNASLNPALALIFISPFIPSSVLRSRKNRRIPASEEYIRKFGPLIDYGLFFFGLANAGVRLSETSNLTLVIFLSLFIGKAAGITLFSYIAYLSGFSLPGGMQWKEVFIIGLTAGMGLTVALYVAGCAYTVPSITAAAKMGALCSVMSAPIAIILSRILNIRKIQ